MHQITKSFLCLLPGQNSLMKQASRQSFQIQSGTYLVGVVFLDSGDLLSLLREHLGESVVDGREGPIDCFGCEALAES